MVFTAYTVEFSLLAVLANCLRNITRMRVLQVYPRRRA